LPSPEQMQLVITFANEAAIATRQRAA
jgi:hypothetical protein